MKRYKITQLLDIEPAFVVFLCAYYYFDPAQTFAPFLLSITLHEAGHLLALRLLGAKVHKLRLSVCGAVLITEPLPYAKEMIAAAAGPAVNILLLAAAMSREPMLALVNLCLCAYNLLPFYPLDGGRILRAVLRLLLSERAADVIERVIAGACLLVLIALACYLTCVWHAGLWPIIVCALLLLRVAGTILPEKKRIRS